MINNKITNFRILIIQNKKMTILIVLIKLKINKKISKRAQLIHKMIFKIQQIKTKM